MSYSRKGSRSLFSLIWSVVSWIMVIAVAVLAVLLVGVRVAGYTPFAIISPSMTPEYQVGDLVYVKKTPSEEIRVGDVITYVVNSEQLIVTHRVDAVDRENGFVYTKGDANKDRDAAPVYFENIVGTVRFSLPKLGMLSIYLSSEAGRYVCAAVVFAVILLFVVGELFKPQTGTSNRDKQFGKDVRQSGNAPSASTDKKTC